MSGRPKMLSSQPKRSWGDSDDENERPEFVLNSEDWPPTPPKSRPAKSSTAASSTTIVNKGKAVARTVVSGAGVKVGSVNYSFASGTTASSSRASGSGATARPLVSRQSEPVKASQPLVDLPLAPLFSRQQRPTPTSSAASSSTSRPLSSNASESRIAHGSNIFALNNPATAGSNGSALPRKRTLPWEELEASSSRGPRAGSKNFHELSGPAGAANGNKRRISSEMKGKLLTSDTIDIKQKVVLSPEQQVVLKLVVEEGKNVFFTGSAGALTFGVSAFTFAPLTLARRVTSTQEPASLSSCAKSSALSSASTAAAATLSPSRLRRGWPRATSAERPFTLSPGSDSASERLTSSSVTS